MNKIARVVHISELKSELCSDWLSTYNSQRETKEIICAKKSKLHPKYQAIFGVGRGRVLEVFGTFSCILIAFILKDFWFSECLLFRVKLSILGPIPAFFGFEIFWGVSVKLKHFLFSEYFSVFALLVVLSLCGWMVGGFLVITQPVHRVNFTGMLLCDYICTHCILTHCLVPIVQDPSKTVKLTL